MKLKMTEEKKIRMIQMKFSVEDPKTQVEIAKELGVSTGTISRWIWYEVAEIYLTKLRNDLGRPKGLTNEELMKKYSVNTFQLNRIINYGKEWFNDKKKENEEEK